MLTPWGYSVGGSLPDLITVDEFNDATGNRYADRTNVPDAISAASASIRSYCGWHVAPVLECVCVLDGERGDIWLPTCGLTAVESVEFDGAAQVVKGFNRLGRVRTDQPQPCGLGNVTVTYTAGFDLCACADLMRVVVQRVEATIALQSYGVSQETAGNMSISYSGAALSDVGGAYIPPTAAVALQPYKLVRSHAV